MGIENLVRMAMRAKGYAVSKRRDTEMSWHGAVAVYSVSEVAVALECRGSKCHGTVPLQ